MLTSAPRLLFNEKYKTVPMHHDWIIREDGTQSIQYSWETERMKNHVSMTYQPEWQFAALDSCEYFLMRRNFGYTLQKRGDTGIMRMDHPEWRFAPGIDAKMEADIVEVFGTEFVPYLTLKPASAFMAEGSQIKMSPAGALWGLQQNKEGAPRRALP